MSLPLTFCISLFLSIALVPFFIRHSAWLGLVDVPDGVRKIHTQTIPRCGGIAIALAALLPSVYFSPSLPGQASFLAGALIIVFFGIIDDRYDLDFRWKFFGQIIAALIFVFSLPEIVHLPFFLDPNVWAWLGYVGIFIFVLGATNAVNLSDGLDGLAGGTILLSLTLLAYLAYVADIHLVAVVAIALIGALLGFLRYNTHPATVFMGDTGSQFIGFTTAALSILLTQSSNCAISPVLPLLILGLPLIDTAMVMSIRLSQGRSPFSPDKNHIHHQLIRFGFYHYEAVAIIYVVQIMFIALAFTLRYTDDTILLIIYIAYAGTLLAALYILHAIKWTFRRETQQFVERRNPLLRRFSFLHTYGPYLVLILLSAFWLVLMLTEQQLDTTIPWLAVGILIISFAASILKPNQSLFITRLISYSVCALTLYPHWSHPSVLIDPIADGFTVAICVILALSIMVTRRENFRLDNQDILMLVLLLAASLLPLATETVVEMSDMVVRLVVMLYAVEFVINSLHKRVVFLHTACFIMLFSIALNL